jgi:adenylate cyclase
MTDANQSGDQGWLTYFTGEGDSSEKRLRPFFSWMPSDPRCKLCGSPFKGLGGVLMRMILDKGPSPSNPHLCNACRREAEKHPGGVELEISILFADVRGSTTLAEQMRPAEFSALINRFFRVSTEVLKDTDAFIDRIIGDEVLGLYVPGIAGPLHAQKAVQAARLILERTGHNDPEGPWIPVGAGVHTGLAYVGTVGSKDGSIDITALGDAVNIAARLAAQAKAGEILVSEETSYAAGIDTSEVEMRQLNLKGRQQPVAVRVLNARELAVPG